MNACVSDSVSPPCPTPLAAVLHESSGWFRCVMTASRQDSWQEAGFRPTVISRSISILTVLVDGFK